MILEHLHQKGFTHHKLISFIGENFTDFVLFKEFLLIENTKSEVHGCTFSKK